MRIISNEELFVVSGGSANTNTSGLQEVEARQSWNDLCDKIDAFNNDKNRIYQPEATTGW